MTSSDSSSGSEEFEKFKNTQQYKEKEQLIVDARLRIARQWILVVVVYYVLRAVFIIFPDFTTEADSHSSMIFTAIELFQLFICMFIVSVVAWTYKNKMDPIKHLLYLQCI